MGLHILNLILFKLGNKYLPIIMDKHKNDTLEKKKKPKPKPRCFQCKKKLKMTELNFICKCKHTFCHLHLNPHSHKCTFDYLKERQEQIQKDNPKMCQQCIEVK